MSRKTRGKGAYGLVKMRYIKNRGARGQTVTANLQKVVFYNVYGDKKLNPEMKQRGAILDQHGEVVRYGEYKSWAMGRAVHHPYAYRVIASPKGHGLANGDFIQAIRTAGERTGFGEQFMIVIHRDTDHTHAHVIFFSDVTMSRKTLEEWKVGFREQIIEIEEAKGMSPDSREQGSALEEKKPIRRGRRRRRRRSKSKEKGLEV